jgi:hypothetical protein
MVRSLAGGGAGGGGWHVRHSRSLSLWTRSNFSILNHCYPPTIKTAQESCVAGKAVCRLHAVERYRTRGIKIHFGGQGSPSRLCDCWSDSSRKQGWPDISSLWFLFISWIDHTFFAWFLGSYTRRILCESQIMQHMDKYMHMITHYDLSNIAFRTEITCTHMIRMTWTCNYLYRNHRNHVNAVFLYDALTCHAQ